MVDGEVVVGEKSLILETADQIASIAWVLSFLIDFSGTSKIVTEQFSPAQIKSLSLYAEVK